jgi:phosphoenolpyruvate synthase/pyruvate phosphate dikinase
MRVAGLPVPDGFLLTPTFLTAFAAASASERRAHLNRLRRRLASTVFAVRSCASDEDDAKHSFAGVFESVLNVDRHGLEAAISKVRASFEAARVKFYTGTGGAGSVLVQRMIAAEYAGVLFTRDPSASGLVIELAGAPLRIRVGRRPSAHPAFGRVSGRQFGEGSTPIDLRPLLALGQQVEQLSLPQTSNGLRADASIVRCRDITRT